MDKITLSAMVDDHVEWYERHVEDSEGMAKEVGDAWAVNPRTLLLRVALDEDYSIVSSGKSINQMRPAVSVESVGRRT